MAGKVSVIELNADMTFRERKRKTDVNNVDIDKDTKPSFVLGRSVFQELIPFWKRFLLRKKPRNLILWLHGASSCFAITEQDLNSYESDIWSRTEKKRYVNKLAVKSKAEQKPIQTWQFLLITGLLIMVLLIQILSMRGMRF